MMEEERVCMRVRRADDTALVATDRAARGASNEVRLTLPRAREEELCFTFLGGMLRGRCDALMRWCGVMMTKRGLGALWEVGRRVYLLTRRGEGGP
jgi:hypothetical protein